MTVTVINNSNIRKPIQSLLNFDQSLSSKLTRTTSAILTKDFNSNPLKKFLSTSEPTLNQTQKLKQKNQIVKNSFQRKKYFSIEQIPSDNEDDEKIEKPKQLKKYSSPRHRLMTCTSGMSDSLVDLSSSYVMQNRPP